MNAPIEIIKEIFCNTNLEVLMNLLLLSAKDNYFSNINFVISWDTSKLTKLSVIIIINLVLKKNKKDILAHYWYSIKLLSSYISSSGWAVYRDWSLVLFCIKTCKYCDHLSIIKVVWALISKTWHSMFVYLFIEWSGWIWATSLLSKVTDQNVI